MDKNKNFIERATQIHGPKYDYSKSIYVSNIIPLKIICDMHGEFEQKPQVHLRGSGCKKCHYESLFLTTDQFIERSKIKHNNLYNYENTIYTGSDKKVIITCEIHGEFEQFPADHLNGSGCKLCAHSVKYSTDDFIKKSKEIHGNKYNYDNSTYVRNNYKTEIICNQHGSFMQTPKAHMNGSGCSLCGHEMSNRKSTKNTSQFIEESNKIHNNKYNYTETEYTHSTDKLFVECEKHGKFSTIANNHLQGHGCPVCAKQNFRSKPEFEIKEFLESFDVEVKHTYYLNGTELDLYIPSYNLAIEFDGLFYHSSGSVDTDAVISKKHIKKTELCEANGITLLHIFENEWENKKSIWKSMIRHRLGFSTKIHGRKTVCRDITSKLADEFCKNNHMQGIARAKYHYGLYYNQQLVSVISIAGSRYNDNDFEVIRYCNILDHNVVGGFSKLIKHFRSLHSGSIVSYANRRWSKGGLYKASGFVEERITGPCYYYIKNDKIQHRSVFMKHKLNSQIDNFNPDLTEVENMYNNKYRRIWDCGTIVYVMPASEISINCTPFSILSGDK